MDLVEQVVNERFDEKVPEIMKKVLKEEQGELDIDDKRKALKIVQDEGYSIGLVIQSERKIEKVEKKIEDDEDHLSKKTQEKLRKDIQNTKRMIDLNKKLKELQHDKEWDEIVQDWNDGNFLPDQQPVDF